MERLYNDPYLSLTTTRPCLIRQDKTIRPRAHVPLSICAVRCGGGDGDCSAVLLVTASGVAKDCDLSKMVRFDEGPNRKRTRKREGRKREKGQWRGRPGVGNQKGGGLLLLSTAAQGARGSKRLGGPRQRGPHLGGRWLHVAPIR